MRKNELSEANGQHRPRLLELDVLRGLAAAGVVACHYASACYEIGRLPSDFRLGSYGPHLFFLISGFVIWMTLSRCPSPRDFVFARFSRLFPVYWLGVAAMALGMLMFPGRFSETLTPTHLWGNLTMCQTWLGIPDLDVSYWTLGVELKFYGLMCLLLCFGWLARIEGLLVIWICSVVIVRLADQLWGLPHALGTPLIVDYAHLFAAGVMFYRLREHGHAWWRHGLILAAVPLQFWASDLEATLMVLGFLITFYALLAGRLTFLVCRPLVFLGNVSYSWYVLHGVIGALLIPFLHELGLPVWVMLLLPTLLGLWVSHSVTSHWERPSLDALRTWYRSRNSLSADPPKVSAKLAG